MINNRMLKDVILSNEQFIINDLDWMVPRECISFPERLKKVCVLYGARRSGKTYILFSIFKENHTSSLYIDFEDERLEGFELMDFEKLKEVFFEMKVELLGSKEVIFLFDEIHIVEGWEKFCRRLVEKEGIRVFVAGSSSKIMPREIQTSLRGRSWGIEVFPFSFREFLSAKGIDVNEKKIIYGREKPITKKYFLEFLKWGGFPEVTLAASDFEKKKILKEYIEAMYFKDLVERFKIRNISLLETLWAKIFSSFSTKISLKAFYRQFKDKLPFSKETLYLYYNHFLKSWLVFEIEKFSESEYVRKRNPGKVYLIDTGLSRKVTSEDNGRLLENLVFLEFRRRNAEIFYFEDKKECDFIIKEDDNLSAYQVTWELNEKSERREINGLLEACKQLGLRKGMILTYDYEDNFKKDKIEIEILPVWKWLIIQS